MSALITDTPLGFVWLAANYDKKLTKAQLLNASIEQSSQLITNTITLRLSGQLLLGIVRIYSRKTKYLLDDVNDILVKLKTSFRSASGATLGSETGATNLSIQDSVVKNVKSITLQDQVTKFDLLYQEDLNLDEPVNFFTQASEEMEESLDAFDASVEYGRQEEAPDVGLELDFDLSDDSIEVGRDAAPVVQDMSDIFNLDLEKETVATNQEPEREIPQISEISERVRTETPRQRPQTSRQERGLPKRKLVVDDEPVLSIQVLKDNQDHILYGERVKQITQEEILNQIFESTLTIPPKRRKLWDIDSHYEDLHRKCLLVARREREQDDADELDEVDEVDNDLDFDLSLPDLEEDTTNISEFSDSFEESPVKATTQVAGLLREVFHDKTETNLAEIMEKDMETEFPLAYTKDKLSPRREAAKCFFELLVLATNDCVGLKEDEGIRVEKREGLFSKFL